MRCSLFKLWRKNSLDLRVTKQRIDFESVLMKKLQRKAETIRERFPLKQWRRILKSWQKLNFKAQELVFTLPFCTLVAFFLYFALTHDLSSSLNNVSSSVGSGDITKTLQKISLQPTAYKRNVPAVRVISNCRNNYNSTKKKEPLYKAPFTAMRTEQTGLCHLP